MTRHKNPFDDVPPVDPTSLVCEVGDTLIVIREATMERPPNLIVGDAYRVVGRVYYGWDLQLIAGDGPPEIRILNSQILEHFRVSPRPET